jgi:hypothetical protein
MKIRPNRRKSAIFILILIIVSILSSGWVAYDYTSSDGPKGIGFPFAFYVGGGGLCYDPLTTRPITCPFTFDYKNFFIDFIIWISISLALTFSINLVYSKFKKK